MYKAVTFPVGWEILRLTRSKMVNHSAQPHVSQILKATWFFVTKVQFKPARPGYASSLHHLHWESLGATPRNISNSDTEALLISESQHLASTSPGTKSGLKKLCN